MRYFAKSLCCLLSACLLSGCAGSSSQLLEEKKTGAQSDIWGTEAAETAAEQNGVPLGYISGEEPSFSSGTLSMPALHVLALSDTTFCAIFLSGSDAILVGAGSDTEAQSIVSYLDSLSVKRCAILLPDLAETEAGGLPALLEDMGDRIDTVILPITSTSEFTASIFDAVAERYPITIPKEGSIYHCFGYKVEFFYPYGTEPATSDSGFAIRITADNTKTLLVSGSDTTMLNTLVSEKELVADVVVNFSDAFDGELYRAIGGRYAYASFKNTDSVNVRSQYSFAQQYQDAGYALSRPDSDKTCVYLFGDTVSMRTHVWEETSGIFLQQTQEETTMDASMTGFWDGTYYHRSTGCSSINTLELLWEITLETAEESEYPRCPYCWKN